jgi:hypothetical protein
LLKLVSPSSSPCKTASTLIYQKLQNDTAKMHFTTSTMLFVLATVLPLASAHFTVEYPYWRGSSFADGASQWIFPCKSSSIFHIKLPNSSKP